MSTSTLPAHCTVTSWLIRGDEPIDGTRADYGTVLRDDFLDGMSTTGARQVTTDLWDAVQPDGTIRRYRAIAAAGKES